MAALALLLPFLVASTFASWTASNSSPTNTLATGSWLLSSWGTSNLGQTGLVSVNSGSNSTIPIALPGPETWASISTGHQDTCAITDAQALYCWGYNGLGQLGDGTVGDEFDPELIAGSWSSISAGYDGTCGIKTDQTLWCWGYNVHGSVGDSTTADKHAPTAATVSGTTTWLSVSVGQYFACGLKTDHTLWCWGNNGNGELGIGSTTDATLPTQVGATTWSAVGTGYDHACAVKSSDSSLWCWGYNAQGQLGDASTTQRTSPVAVAGGGTWTAVSGGILHTCATRVSGAMYCWGYNAYGQVGDGTTTTPRSSPTLVTTSGVTTWSTVTLGQNTSCGLKTDNTLWCWGHNDLGMLGNGNTTDQPTPVSPGTSTYNTISGGFQHVCGIRSGGTIWCQGYDGYGIAGQTKDYGVFAPSQLPLTASAWASGAQATTDGCGVKSDGTIWCWGNNAYGQDGDSTVTVNLAPDRAGSGTNWSTVSMGHYTTCGLTTAGSNNLLCWGYGGSNQFGTGSTTDQHAPTAGPAGSWSSVSVGDTHTCAINTAHSLYCWGTNDQGQVGNGTTTLATTPVAITASGVSGWASVSAGVANTCAISTAASTNSSALYCWGYNGHGQDGKGGAAGSPANYQSPQLLSTGWQSVGVGFYNTCAVKTTGTLWCFGYNNDGQLGNGSSGADVTSPAQIGAVTTWSTAASGDGFSCATRTDRTLWCWGTDTSGQLGDRNKMQQNSPQLVPNVKFSYLDGHGNVDGMIAWG
ncbi:alpha-tubulin suppressor-like RCC1 family protein [Jatrophihabitans sp. GAS493]|uniref:RCC1 domain-containing protein n=1 Tax=Jatrophihabitans sp. GAS493 TaxID=1907575 RepID=UPI000BB8549E|nr:hypothetical protein [Jatrophihabitans sp. GAS493]SOD74894.1 alpha-tubulin suppressor-like RCC1 family protein [Jatrophihabitans sp. GAS493]